MEAYEIPEEYIDIQLDSEQIVEAYYSYAQAKLESDKESCNLYLEIIKELVTKERENYSKISQVEACQIMGKIDPDETMNQVVNRIYTRIKEKADMIAIDVPKINNGITLYNVVKSNINILTLKMLRQKINGITIANEEEKNKKETFINISMK